MTVKWLCEVVVLYFYKKKISLLSFLRSRSTSLRNGKPTESKRNQINVFHSRNCIDGDI